MISDKMILALNEQIKLEGYASFLYLSMSAWCNHEALEGCSKFMQRQSDEERFHMLKIFDYLYEVDAHALAPSIPQPPHTFENIQTLFQQVYEHEQKVTRSIHQIVDLANQENDFATLNFLQWYIEEQREEESLIRTILDKIKLIGDGPQSLYYIDKEIESINASELRQEASE